MDCCSDLQPNMPKNNISDNLLSASVTLSEIAGIKLSSLQKFIDECGGNSALTGLTTSDVYDLHWKKTITLEFGIAQIFVSFSWEYDFLDVVLRLQRLFQDSPDLFIWMDFFIIARNLNINTTHLISSKQFHHMVLMLTPWNNSTRLKRLSCNSECKCTYLISMSPADEEEFRHAIEKNCIYAERLAILSSEMYKLPRTNIEYVWYIPLISMDSKMLSSLVKGLGYGFEICSAIISYKKVTGSILVNISTEFDMIAKLQELGIHSLFHQKVIAQNILIWKNRIYDTCIPDIRIINPNIDVKVLSTIEYSNNTFQYPVDGMKLSSLEKFIDECGGWLALEGLTTTEVVKMFIKPLVFHKKSSFCEYLKTIDPSSVAEAQVFISHAWRYQFLDLVDTLQSHFEKNQDIFIWIDIFSMSPFIEPIVDVEVDDFLWSIMSIIRKVKHTVFIFSPWKYTMTAWILHEILCTVCHTTRKEDCKFEIAMSSDDKKKLLRIGATGIKSILQQIDCRNSTTSDPLSQMRILYLIETTVGFDVMNKLVFDSMTDILMPLMTKEEVREGGTIAK